MPINVPRALPARPILEKENIFIMESDRATTQDIRPLNLLLLNLMPEKERTETQLLRLLSNSPLQVNVDFIHTATYESKNVTKSHLEKFYQTFDAIKTRYYDGMIITGAPVEHLDFEDVEYWKEMVEIMNWSKDHVTSTLHICWGAQAALYHHYGIDKQPRDKKISGIFMHQRIEATNKLMRGINDEFLAPHSRKTDAIYQYIKHHPDLLMLDDSKEAGPLLIASKDERHVMITGHIEYDADTLNEEFIRDLNKGIKVDAPTNYFPNNNPNEDPKNRWRSLAYLLFSNWLNYYVYQETPFKWD
ncbi:homoserine O-succinyltransferase [Halolactibacillus halophilus]|uniref:Homoserine O-acetyltransferase n=1 Tax=Halolactibacillus halophilus TaxID=306540 RepID=A0A1I5N9Z4_9BACI|nr:homoserine O-succinyltransferase [Halolactibacillus halophilus]GEM01170.1 homoserine O-succinyltransferase [Halolactibacillus halophilus]SFP18512.1 homoserine O-succinyltransferase [Halolactibacillus halophilus]